MLAEKGKIKRAVPTPAGNRDLQSSFVAQCRTVNPATGKPFGSVVVLPAGEWAYAALALGSALALFAYPHATTGVFAAKRRDVIRRNAAMLPAYSLVLSLIALFGYMVRAVPTVTFPAIVIGLYRRWFHRAALIVGWAVGMVYGTAQAYRTPGDGQAHFGSSAAPVFGQTTYIAISALILNVVVAAVLTLISASSGCGNGYDATRPADYSAEPGDRARRRSRTRAARDPVAGAAAYVALPRRGRGATRADTASM